MIINFSSEIEQDAFDEFLEKIQEADDRESPIEFWISSPGGRMDLMYSIKEILEERKASLVGHGCISSAACLLYLLYKGNKRVTDYCEGMVHQGTFGLNYRGNGERNSFAKDLLESNKQREIILSTLCKESFDLTEEQLQAYNDGHDVFITNLQLKKLERREESTKKSNKVQNRPNSRTKGSKTTDRGE